MLAGGVRNGDVFGDGRVGVQRRAPSAGSRRAVARLVAALVAGGGRAGALGPRRHTRSAHGRHVGGAVQAVSGGRNGFATAEPIREAGNTRP